jgi:hypothetical protein
MTQPAPSLQEKLKSLEQELATYRRELPRLLAEGEAGRFLVIRGEELLGTWDTYRDASQYAREKFDPDQRFLLQRIDPRHTAMWDQFFPAGDVPCPS